MVEAGCTHCFMEVSSHAIVQGRIHGLRFAGGVFTNLTHDHLDYHGTFSEYLKAKQMFFDNLPTKTFALTNVDDTNGNVMVQNTKATISTYAINRPANFKTRILQNSITGLGLNIDGTEAWFRLVGRFNAYNITAIFATAVLCGLDKNEVLRELSGLAEVDGRFNVIRSSNNITGIVDYAHTPDALSNVLTTITEVNDGNGRIITVAGAGGDRDRSKRPVMGQIMAKYSQLAIITSDNPRSEDPETIIAEIKSGIDITEIKKVLCIADRREAIRTACMMALPGDIVLIAGKGHETYQEVNGVKTHFNDVEILSESLNV
jgi:UDP-N-acetylmuramoyl-L-alanyl-D-glutamate--2,6-diaminopimelate ligase